MSKQGGDNTGTVHVHNTRDNSKHVSSQHSPFFLNRGRHPSTPFSDIVTKRAQVPAVTTFLEGLQSALQDAKTNITAAQVRQKAYADKKRREHQFKRGSKFCWLSYSSNCPLKSPPSYLLSILAPNSLSLLLLGKVHSDWTCLLLFIFIMSSMYQLKPWVAADDLHPARPATQPGPVNASRLFVLIFPLFRRYQCVVSAERRNIETKSRDACTK